MLTASKTPGSPSQPLDGADQLIRGVFEPPRSFALAAIGRGKWIVAALTVLAAVGGAAYGVSRPRTYTTSATLQIGQVNPNSPGFYGYVQSAASLATAFSRAIYAEPVLHSVELSQGLSAAQAVGRLSASPIPVSPAFRVIATGPSQRAAIDLANAAASAVIVYEGKSNSTNPQAASLLREYQSASRALRRAVLASADLSRNKGASIGARATAEATRNAAAVKLRAIGVAYTNAITSAAPSSGLVSLVAGAASATSDHRSKIELFGFIGALAGVLAGCLLAILRERRRVARSEIPRSDAV